MNFRSANHSDLSTIKGLLEKENLPFSDISEILGHISIAENDNKELIGIAALENYDKIALLRSLVVITSQRNKGYGTIILAHMLESARQDGITELYLLTQDTHSYFSRHSFVEISREEVPSEIKDTRQFSSLCPTSAKVMINQLYV